MDSRNPEFISAGEGERSWRSRARIRMQREQRLIVAACTRTRHVKTRAWRLDFFSREPRPRSWINEARGNFRFREENEPHDKFFDPYSSFLFFSHRQLIINFIKLRFEGRVYWLIEKNKKEKMEKKRNGIKNGGEKRRIYGGKIVNCDWLFKLQRQKKKERNTERPRDSFSRSGMQLRAQLAMDGIARVVSVQFWGKHGEQFSEIILIRRGINSYCATPERIAPHPSFSILYTDKYLKEGKERERSFGKKGGRGEPFLVVERQAVPLTTSIIPLC